MVRNIGLGLVSNTRLEPYCYRMYERLLMVRRTGGFRLGGFYEININHPDIEPFELWLEESGVTQLDKFAGSYELAVVNTIANTISRDDTFWVVGAGYGYHSFAFAPHCNRVDAFEANPRRVRKLSRGIGRNAADNIVVHRTRVGHDASLDHFGTPDIVLMDVEGAEHDILADTKLIEKTDITWVVELHGEGTPAGQPAASPDAVVNLFKDAGCTVSLVSKRRPGNYHILAVP